MMLPVGKLLESDVGAGFCRMNHVSNKRQDKQRIDLKLFFFNVLLSLLDLPILSYFSNFFHLFPASTTRKVVPTGLDETCVYLFIPQTPTKSTPCAELWGDTSRQDGHGSCPHSAPGFQGQRGDQTKTGSWVGLTISQTLVASESPATFPLPPIPSSL